MNDFAKWALEHLERVFRLPAKWLVVLIQSDYRELQLAIPVGADDAHE